MLNESGQPEWRDRDFESGQLARSSFSRLRARCSQTNTAFRPYLSQLVDTTPGIPDAIVAAGLHYCFQV
jgi:hypothetical protein